MAKPIIVEGKTVLVPDDATPAEMLQIANEHAAPAPAPAPAEKPMSFAEKAKDIAKSGVTGLSEGVAGLVGLPGTISDVMDTGLTALANKITGANVQLPKSPVSGEAINRGISNLVGGYYEPQTVAGEYARTIGQFAPGMVTGPQGIIPRVASAVIPAVASEAAGQATKGTAAEPAARIAGALLAPAGVGLVKRTGSSLARALSGAAKPSVVDEIAPTIAQYKQAGGNLFDEVFQDPNKNVIISKNALSRLSKEVKDIAVQHGYDPDVNKEATVLIKKIQNLPKNNSTLVGVEMARRLATNVSTKDRVLGGKITQAITDFMDDLDDADIIGVAGAADKTGPAILAQARDAWRTMKKATTIQNVIDNADITAGANYSQAGAEQALQRGFANLAKNAKRMAQFSPEEQNAIKLAAKGSGVQNAMKLLGKFAIRGPVSAGATTVIGHLLGPAGPYVLAGMGEAAKRGAASGTQANVEALSALVRGGPSATQRLQAIRTAKMLEALKSYGPAAGGAIGYAATPALANEQ